MEPSSSSSSSCPYTNPQVFYNSLTKGIDDLESMLQTDNNNENNFMSIQFLHTVLAITRFHHTQVTNWAQILKLPAGGNLFNAYIAESVKLMKAIRDIKVGVKRMENYYLRCIALTEFLDTNRVLNSQAVQQTITAIKDCTQAAEELEKDNASLSANWKDLRQIEVVNPENYSTQEFHVFVGIMYATRNISKTLLRILLYGLVYCLPQYKFDSYVHNDNKIFDPSFMVSTDKLQHSVESEIYKLTKRTGILWYEYWKSKVALDKLLIEFERVLESGEVVDLESEVGINEIVMNLKGYVVVLKEGSKMMIWQIDRFSNEIIRAVNKIYALGSIK